LKNRRILLLYSLLLLYGLDHVERARRTTPDITDWQANLRQRSIVAALLGRWNGQKFGHHINQHPK